MNKIRDDLWIGDIMDARELPLDEYGVERVITVCQNSVEDNVACAYEQFSFMDGPHDYELFKSAVEATVAAVEAGETTFVHCHAGQSRSVMVCTAALSELEDLSYDEAFWQVRTARGVTHPSDELTLSATKYVNRLRFSHED